MGRSRGGLTTRIHAVVDTNCLPVRLPLTAGQTHDNRLVPKLLSRLKSGTMLLAVCSLSVAFVLGMAIHYEAHAKHAPHLTPIYYCETGQ